MRHGMLGGLVLAAVVLGASAGSAADTDFTVIAYHDVVDSPDQLTYDAITLRHLAMQFDWLRENGYRVVSVDDLLAAQRGERPLPRKSVLLTFDDGYRSFYTHAYPLLTAFKYPAVLSVVGSFLNVPPRAQVRYGTSLVAREDFVSWAQLREMQRSGLVEIGSHTYGLHTTIYTNPQGGEVPAATGQGFIRRRPGPRIGERIPLQMPQPSFGDIRSLLTMPYRPYLDLAIELAQAAIDYAYDPRTGRYESDEEYRRRIRADLERNSELLEANLGARPRVITWPYGRWNAVTLAAAREAGMPIGLTLDEQHANTRELGRVGRFYPTQNPDVRFFSSFLTQPPQPELLRGLCVQMDEMYAPSEDEQEALLGKVIDRIHAFKPNAVLLAAASAVPGAGVYFPTDRLPVRADMFSRVAWQIRSRAGVAVYAYLPAALAGGDPEKATALYGALARSVPLDGAVVDPIVPFLSDLSTTPLAPGVSRWDPRVPRWVREAQDRAGLPHRTRLALGVLDAVTRYQPSARLLQVVKLPDLRRPAEMTADAVDYVGLQWDGPPDEALRKLRDLGWLEGDHWGRLTLLSARGVPAEWRRVQRTGLLNGVYCPDRLIDRDRELAAMSAVVGGSTFPFRP
jgi:peptidoglycan/xylan/chitin deacetylase (PgdA/CDA1 family)